MNYETENDTFGRLSRLALVVASTALLPTTSGRFGQGALQAEGPAKSGAKNERPKIVSTVPKIGATDVDVELKEIRVKFDRDMSPGMSWTGGEPLFPKQDKTSKARWIDKRTCVLPVQLESGTYYRVGINSTSHQNFKSTKGVAASPSAIYFVTVGAEPDVAERVRVPKIIKFEPDNRSESVDPAIKEIRITFDAPMGDGMSWTGGGDEFPRIVDGQRGFWSEDQKTCTLPVVLETGHKYRLGINSPSHINFQSEWGVPLAPVEYTFQTQPVKEAK